MWFEIRQTDDMNSPYNGVTIMQKIFDLLGEGISNQIGH